MTAPTLSDVVAALSDSAECHAGAAVKFRPGIVYRPLICTDRITVVTLACEHEHSYDVALCDTHIAKAAVDLLRCPFCNEHTDEKHLCRHGVLRVSR